MQHAFGLSAFAHLHNAFHYVVIVDDGSIIVTNGLAQLAQANLGTLGHDRDVAHPHRRSVLYLQHGRANVVGGLHQPHGANVVGLLAFLDEASAAVDVIGNERLLHLRHRNPVGHQLVGIDLHLIFASLATKNRYRGHVGHRHQVLEDDPILQGLQIHDVVLGIGALQCVEVDLSGRTEVGPDLRIQSRRQIHQRQLFQHLLAILQVVGLVVEDGGDERQAGQRCRAQMRQVSQAVHLGFDGNRNLLLDLFGGSSRPLGNHPDIFVGHIGIGFHRKVMERDDAPDQQRHAQRQHQHAVLQREINQVADHARLLLRRAGEL